MRSCFRGCVGVLASRISIMLTVYIRILIMQVKVVLPMRWDWLIMLLLIGFFGFCAQVLLTMGLQREAVGRGTMAVYVQVRRFLHAYEPNGQQSSN